MTKLRAHYDAKLKAFVPEEAGDWPDGTQADVELADDAAAADEGRDLPPFPKDAGYFITGGPGVTGQELVKLIDELNKESETAFPEPEDSQTLARKLREQGR